MGISLNLGYTTSCLGMFSPLPPSKSSWPLPSFPPPNFVFAMNFSFSTAMGLGDMVEGRHEAEMCVIAESEYALFFMF